MTDDLEVAKRALANHLQRNGFDGPSIRRVIDEDFPYLTEWLIKPSLEEELRMGKSIISFAFGFGPLKEGVHNPPNPNQFNPQFHYVGKSNDAIADVIKRLYDNGLELPIYAQWEIAEALRKRHDIILPDSQIARPRDGYLGTHGVIEQWLDNELNLHNPIILVAHPYHVFRCKKIIENVSAKREKPFDILIADTSSVPFDPVSLQRWTRNLNEWIMYEVGNRFSNRYRGLMDNYKR